MKHAILRTFSLLLLTLSPAALWAADAVSQETETAEIASAAQGEVSLEVQGRNLHILNAQGQALEVFDITGKLVVSQRIDSNDKHVALTLGKGCYIIRVGKLTRKIALS